MCDLDAVRRGQVEPTERGGGGGSRGSRRWQHAQAWGGSGMDVAGAASSGVGMIRTGWRVVLLLLLLLGGRLHGSVAPRQARRIDREAQGECGLGCKRQGGFWTSTCHAIRSGLIPLAMGQVTACAPADEFSSQPAAPVRAPRRA